MKERGRSREKQRVGKREVGRGSRKREEERGREREERQKETYGQIEVTEGANRRSPLRPRGGPGGRPGRGEGVERRDG